jgi:hypothetical protein
MHGAPHIDDLLLESRWKGNLISGPCWPHLVGGQLLKKSSSFPAMAMHALSLGTQSAKAMTRNIFISVVVVMRKGKRRWKGVALLMLIVLSCGKRERKRKCLIVVMCRRRILNLFGDCCGKKHFPVARELKESVQVKQRPGHVALGSVN